MLVQDCYVQGLTGLPHSSLELQGVEEKRRGRLKGRGSRASRGFFVVELVTQWSSDPTEINSTAMRHVVKR